MLHTTKRPNRFMVTPLAFTVKRNPCRACPWSSPCRCCPHSTLRAGSPPRTFLPCQCKHMVCQLVRASGGNTRIWHDERTPAIRRQLHRRWQTLQARGETLETQGETTKPFQTFAICITASAPANKGQVNGVRRCVRPSCVPKGNTKAQPRTQQANWGQDLVAASHATRPLPVMLLGSTLT